MQPTMATDRQFLVFEDEKIDDCVQVIREIAADFAERRWAVKIVDGVSGDALGREVVSGSGACDQ